MGVAKGAAAGTAEGGLLAKGSKLAAAADAGWGVMNGSNANGSAAAEVAAGCRMLPALMTADLGTVFLPLLLARTASLLSSAPNTSSSAALN